MIIELHSSAIDPVCKKKDVRTSSGAISKSCLKKRYKKQTLPSIWAFPKMVVPPFHTPKWSFLVGKPRVVGYPTILGNPHLMQRNIGAWNVEFFRVLVRSPNFWIGRFRQRNITGPHLLKNLRGKTIASLICCKSYC